MLAELEMGEQMRYVSTAHERRHHSFCWGNHLWNAGWSIATGFAPGFVGVLDALNLLGAMSSAEMVSASIDRIDDHWRRSNEMWDRDIGAVFIENGGQNSTNFKFSPFPAAPLISD